MNKIFAAVALSIAVPSFAQAPAAHADHAKHECCKGMACCEKMKGKADCCKDKAAAKGKAAQDPHAGHDMSKSTDAPHKHQ